MNRNMWGGGAVFDAFLSTRELKSSLRWRVNGLKENLTVGTISKRSFFNPFFFFSFY